MNKITIQVKKFTTIPGGRRRGSGDNSAEEFFEDYILPHLENNHDDVVVIDFSGTWGYPISFISQLGLFLKDTLGSKDAVKRRIETIATDNPDVTRLFWELLEEDS